MPRKFVVVILPDRRDREFRKPSRMFLPIRREIRVKQQLSSIDNWRVGAAEMNGMLKVKNYRVRKESVLR